MKNGYHILEIANVHGGNFNYLKKLINGISKYKSPYFGVKLQVFKSDLIALPDFSYFHIYEDLFFDTNHWEEIINLVYETKDVWIDVFDLYGVEIVEKFSDKVFGVKFQASVLDNLEVFKKMANIDMTDKFLMVNVSGLDIDIVKNKIKIIESIINCREIVLQVGFQAYPTPIEYSGLGKINKLKSVFNNKIIYADHTSGEEEDSFLLPILGVHAGAHGIEKHIMLSDEETKYDSEASITLEQLSTYTKMFEKYYKNLDTNFINTKEKEYLINTIQKPVTNRNIKAGAVVQVSDLQFRRTDFDGLSLDEIKNYINEGYILRNNMSKNMTLKAENFKMPTVAAIVACRLKSSRLKDKALLKIGELSSIELCLKNTLKIKEANHVILATSNLEADSELINHTFDSSVIFHQGDPEDVINRYLEICNKMKIDRVIRITGDCPYVSNEIVTILHDSHLRVGSDFTTAIEFAVGTSVEIIEVSALKKIKEHFKSANYSEYMTWYFMNNEEHFKINKVKLPERYVRNYRLTLDYQEDLELLGNIENNFLKNRKEYKLLDLFSFLDENPEIANINQHLTLTYKTDQLLIDTLNRETKIN